MAWPPKIATVPPHLRPHPEYPEPGAQFKHLKRGSTYTIVGKVRLNHTHAGECIPATLQDGNMLVLYVCNEDGVYSARPREEFMDGRFERID